MDSIWCACAGWLVGELLRRKGSNHAISSLGRACFLSSNFSRVDYEHKDSTWCARAGRSVPPARAVLSFCRAWLPMGKGLMLAGSAACAGRSFCRAWPAATASRDSTWCACAGWSVGATRSRHAVAFPGMATNGQGFDVGRVQRLAPVGHCAGHGHQRQRQWIQPGALAPGGRSMPPDHAMPSFCRAWLPMGKGLMLEGFSGSRRVVTVLASDSTNGFNLVRLRRMVGRCHQFAPCCRFSRHGHQRARA